MKSWVCFWAPNKSSTVVYPYNPGILGYKQEDQKFKVILGYIVSWWPSCIQENYSQKKKGKKISLLQTASLHSWLSASPKVTRPESVSQSRLWAISCSLHPDKDSCWLVCFCAASILYLPLLLLCNMKEFRSLVFKHDTWFITFVFVFDYSNTLPASTGT